MPPGTRVLRDGQPIAELAAAGRARAGGPGRQTAASATGPSARPPARRPASRSPARAGEEAWLTLELRLPVDVALVGLPNTRQERAADGPDRRGRRGRPVPALHARARPRARSRTPTGTSTWSPTCPAWPPTAPRAATRHLRAARAGAAWCCTAWTPPAGEPAAAGWSAPAPALAAFAPAGARELVVATRADPAEPAARAPTLARRHRDRRRRGRAARAGHRRAASRLMAVIVVEARVVDAGRRRAGDLRDDVLEARVRDLVRRAPPGPPPGAGHAAARSPAGSGAWASPSAPPRCPTCRPRRRWGRGCCSSATPRRSRPTAWCPRRCC